MSFDATLDSIVCMIDEHFDTKYTSNKERINELYVITRHQEAIDKWVENLIDTHFQSMPGFGHNRNMLLLSLIHDFLVDADSMVYIKDYLTDKIEEFEKVVEKPLVVSFD